MSMLDLFGGDWGEALTKQSFKDSTDINKLLAKAARGESLSHLQRHSRKLSQVNRRLIGKTHIVNQSIKIIHGRRVMRRTYRNLRYREINTIRRVNLRTTKLFPIVPNQTIGTEKEKREKETAQQ